MVKVILNNVVIAETDKYEVVEGNKYFPPESLKKDYFSDSNTQCVGSSFLERATDSFLTDLPAPGKGNNLLRVNERHSPISPRLASYYNVTLPDSTVVEDAGWFVASFNCSRDV